MVTATVTVTATLLLRPAPRGGTRALSPPSGWLDSLKSGGSSRQRPRTPPPLPAVDLHCRGNENMDPDYNLGYWPRPAPPQPLPISPSFLVLLLPLSLPLRPQKSPWPSIPEITKHPHVRILQKILHSELASSPWALHWRGSCFGPALVAPLLVE